MASFSITLDTHSLQQTHYWFIKVELPSKFRVDVIARYLERLMLGDKAAETQLTGQKKDDQ